MALLACVGPLLLAFAWQGGLASLGDDSASYLVVAQAFSRNNSSILPWVGYHTHFPPLFPLALSLAGGSGNFLVAHALVALFAVGSLVLAYRFVLVDTGRRSAAFAVVVAFMLCPTAWISAKAVLSEPMFLFASLAALAYHQSQLADARGTWQQWSILGLLLAAAVLTRIVGATLVAALVVYLGVRGLRERRWVASHELALAVVPSIALLGLWRLLRPIAAQDSYERVSTAMAQSWTYGTGFMASMSANSVLAGWVASFTAEAGVGAAATAATIVVAILAAIGLVLRLARNRLDAWYVAISLGVVYAWVFSEDNTRRLLYPLLPLLLLYAGQAVAEGCARLGRRQWIPAAIGVAGLVMALACVPATALLAQKALDRAPAFPGSEWRMSDITDYYTTLNVQRSRAIAGKHVTVLAGLEAIRRSTPTDARIMWMRPEYVALLGRREGLAWYYAWDPKRLAQEVRAQRIDYLVVAYLHKTDLSGQNGDPSSTLSQVSEYAEPKMALSNPVTGGVEFVLLYVDRARLDAWIAAHPS
jgi:4-amino-4-deoxy-L-arabinose transferase-like glycosyltransferase